MLLIVTLSVIYALISAVFILFSLLEVAEKNNVTKFRIFSVILASLFWPASLLVISLYAIFTPANSNRTAIRTRSPRAANANWPVC